MPTLLYSPKLMLLPVKTQYLRGFAVTAAILPIAHTFFVFDDAFHKLWK